MALTKTRKRSAVVVPAGAAVARGDCVFTPGAMELLTRQFTDLYRDPLVAMVRETISNAIDATVRLGGGERRSVMVDVVGDDAGGHVFRVTDHGVGMSMDDVLEHYVGYGESTKMDDLSMIGSYGYGAKSPLAYADSVTVVTVRDGMLTEFGMYRDDGGNKYVIHRNERTDEPSGTVVSVPIHNGDVSKILDAVMNYKSQLAPVDIMVNGAKQNLDKYLRLTTIQLDPDGGVEGVLYVKRSLVPKLCSSVFQHRVSMSDTMDDLVEYVENYSSCSLNGWMYHLSGSRFWSIPETLCLSIVPGTVDFSPSRDDIMNNDRLRWIVEQIASRVFLLNPDNSLKTDAIERLVHDMEPELLTRIIDSLYKSAGDELFKQKKKFDGSLNYRVLKAFFDKAVKHQPGTVGSIASPNGETMMTGLVMTRVYDYDDTRLAPDCPKMYQAMGTPGGITLVNGYKAMMNGERITGADLPNTTGDMAIHTALRAALARSMTTYYPIIIVSEVDDDMQNHAVLKKLHTMNKALAKALTNRDDKNEPNPLMRKPYIINMVVPRGCDVYGDKSITGLIDQWDIHVHNDIDTLVDYACINGMTRANKPAEPLMIEESLDVLAATLKARTAPRKPATRKSVHAKKTQKPETMYYGINVPAHPNGTQVKALINEANEYNQYTTCNDRSTTVPSSIPNGTAIIIVLSATKELLFSALIQALNMASGDDARNVTILVRNAEKNSEHAWVNKTMEDTPITLMGSNKVRSWKIAEKPNVAFNDSTTTALIMDAVASRDNLIGNAILRYAYSVAGAKGIMNKAMGTFPTEHIIDDETLDVLNREIGTFFSIRPATIPSDVDESVRNAIITVMLFDKRYKGDSLGIAQFPPEQDTAISILELMNGRYRYAHDNTVFLDTMSNSGVTTLVRDQLAPLVRSISEQHATK